MSRPAVPASAAKQYRPRQEGWGGLAQSKYGEAWRNEISGGGADRRHLHRRQSGESARLPTDPELPHPNDQDGTTRAWNEFLRKIAAGI